MEDNILQVSVILCTHNPKPDLLSEVLRHLKNQTLSKDRWELIIVDNCSNPPLHLSAEQSWHSNLQHLSEKKLGQIFARITGIQAAKGKLIVFVDDDNLLQPDYLEVALSIAADHPFLGAFGGSCEGLFAHPPAAWQLPWIDILAVREVKCDLWANFAYWPCMPLGAGMILKKEVAIRHIKKLKEEKKLLKLSRYGTNLMSGDDVDMVLTCLENGGACGVFRSLRLTHVIPANRLGDEYHLQLTAGIHASSAWQIYVRQGPSAVKFHYALRPLFTALKEGLKFRQHAWRSVVFEIQRLWAIRKGYAIAKKMIRHDQQD